MDCRAARGKPRKISRFHALGFGDNLNLKKLLGGAGIITVIALITELAGFSCNNVEKCISPPTALIL